MKRSSVRLAWVAAALVLVAAAALTYVKVEASNRGGGAETTFQQDASPTTQDGAEDTSATGCTGAANTPGGPDPWGGCWPGPGNTGVPDGIKLKVISGDLTISDPGFVLENTEVLGCITLTVEANNVTIRNVRVKANCSQLILNDAGAQGLQVIDSELDGNNFSTSDSGIAGRHYSLTRVDIHGTGDGVKAGSNVLIENSYIHDLHIANDSHNDALQALDADGLVLRHNTAIVKDGATSCVIFSQNANTEWQMRNVHISRNLFAGGAYVIYGGYQAGKDDPARASNISITENQISTVIFPRGGAFGAITSADPPIVTQRGNVWVDGPNAGSTIQ